MYKGGKGVPQNYVEAARWWRKPADQGDADAQYWLALSYGTGNGVPQDYVQAHMWLNLAAAQGAAEAPKMRDLLAAKMTPSQIEKAQALAAAWKPATSNKLCNLYSMTRVQDAMRKLFGVKNDPLGNLPSLPGILPDQSALIVHVGSDGERELVMARWGMPTPPQYKGPVDRGVTNIRNTASAESLDHYRMFDRLMASR